MQDSTRSRLNWFLVLLNKEPDKTLLHSPFKIKFLKPELPLYYLMRQDTGDFVIVCAPFLYTVLLWSVPFSFKFLDFILQNTYNLCLKLKKTFTTPFSSKFVNHYSFSLPNDIQVTKRKLSLDRLHFSQFTTIQGENAKGFYLLIYSIPLRTLLLSLLK